MPHALTFPQLKLDRAGLARGIAAGMVWGIAVSGALLALSFHQCGTICLSQIVDTTLLSVFAGIVAIGPVAAMRRSQPAIS